MNRTTQTHPPKSIESRALAAYWRAGATEQPTDPTLVTVDGLDYVTLSNVNGILAVYRVTTVQGEPKLKRLRRWPRAIAEQFGAEA
jgi:hypothetical protein